MKKFTAVRVLVSGVLAGTMALTVAGLLATNGIAAAKDRACDSFPEVDWWKGLSHKKVVQLVDKKYGGDWNRYIAKWERQLAKLEDVRERGSAVVFRKQGVRLSGKSLANYRQGRSASLGQSLPGEQVGNLDGA